MIILSYCSQKKSVLHDLNVAEVCLKYANTLYLDIFLVNVILGTKKIVRSAPFL